MSERVRAERAERKKGEAEEEVEGEAEEVRDTCVHVFPLFLLLKNK